MIEETAQKLQKAKVCTTLDLKNGVLHAEFIENSRKYTAFVTNEKEY